MSGLARLLATVGGRNRLPLFPSARCACHVLCVYSLPDDLGLAVPKLGSQLGSLLSHLDGREYTAAYDAEYVDLASGKAAETAGPNSKARVGIQFLVQHGVTPYTVNEDYIEAAVPLRLLRELSQQSGVTRIREMIPPQAAAEPPIRPNVAAHLAQHWHADDRKGSGVKVGIIDLRTNSTSRDGFKGLRQFIKSNGLSAKGYCFADFGKSTFRRASFLKTPTRFAQPRTHWFGLRPENGSSHPAPN